MHQQTGFDLIISVDTSVATPGACVRETNLGSARLLRQSEGLACFSVINLSVGKKAPGGTLVGPYGRLVNFHDRPACLDLLADAVTRDSSFVF